MAGKPAIFGDRALFVFSAGVLHNFREVHLFAGFPGLGITISPL
jgi:hypothetical protein